jgi:hypothetical protein
MSAGEEDLPVVGRRPKKDVAKWMVQSVVDDTKG